MSEKLNDTTDKLVHSIMYDHFENQYWSSLKHVLRKGNINMDRTGTGTTMLVGQSIEIDLKQTPIPLLKGKFVSPISSFTEAMWIMMGKTDLAWLKENGVNYWDSWVKEDGTFGPIYGAQMRNQNGTINPGQGIDQLLNVVNTLRNNPDSRRIIIDLWNPAEEHLMSLPPCHVFYQFHTFINETGNRELQLSVYQRSADAFIGVPFDFMLFYWIGKFISWMTGYEFTKIWNAFGNYHIYSNHHTQIEEYFNNVQSNYKQIDFNSPITHKNDFPLPEAYDYVDNKFTVEHLNDALERFWSYKQSILELDGYSREERYPLIKTPVAV